MMDSTFCTSDILIVIVGHDNGSQNAKTQDSSMNEHHRSYEKCKKWQLDREDTAQP
jgi:hypothetical protein